MITIFLLLQNPILALLMSSVFVQFLSFFWLPNLSDLLSWVDFFSGNFFCEWYPETLNQSYHSRKKVFTSHIIDHFGLCVHLWAIFVVRVIQNLIERSEWIRHLKWRPLTELAPLRKKTGSLGYGDNFGKENWSRISKTTQFSKCSWTFCLFAFIQFPS